MRKMHSFVAPIACLALLFLVPSEGTAQGEPPIDIDLRGGIGLPTGNLSDVVDVGPAFNVGFNVGITDRLYLRAEGGGELYEGIDLEDPVGAGGLNELDLDLLHFHGGAVYQLISPERSGLFVTLTGGAGATNFNVPRLQASVGADVEEVDLSELYFSANGGATVGYRVTEQVGLFVDGQSYVVFADEDDTASLLRIVNSVVDDPVDSLDTVWSIPVTAGVRLTF